MSALCLALCVVLPLVFHLLPDGGSVFSPMHIPVLICGLSCGGLWGFVCGILGPVLSSFISGMPNAAYLPSMLIELAAYGLVAGLGMQLIRTGKLYADIYISLAAAMIIGRVLAGLAMGFIFVRGSFTVTMWAGSYFVGAIPGIALHFIIIPILTAALMKAGLIVRRQPNEKY